MRDVLHRATASGYSGYITLLVLCIGCASAPKQEIPPWNVTFFAVGAKVHFSEPAPMVRQLKVFAAEGVQVASLNFPAPPRQTESLYFEWEEGVSYTVAATLSTGDTVSRNVTAPRTYRQGDLEIAIPYGITQEQTDTAGATPDTRQALVLQDSEMTATVLVTNGNRPTTFRMELCLPDAVTAVRFPTGWTQARTDTGVCLATSGTLTVASEVWYREIVLKTSAQNGTERQEISGTVRFTTTDTGETWEQRTQVTLRVASSAAIAERLSIDSIEMPTGASGIADPRYRADTIYTPRPFFRWLRTPQHDAFAPITYQTVRLRNRGAETIHVVVSAINRGSTDSATSAGVPFLAPPEAANGGTDRSAAFASLPGNTVTAIPLPIYFHPVYLEAGRPTAATPGTYRRDVRVQVWGSEETVLREERPLHLVVPNREALLVSLLATVSSCIGFGVVLRYHKQIFAGFTTKHLIVIALFSTTVFVAVIVPSTLLMNLVSAVFGPLSVLITGVINETFYYILLTALLIYISGDPSDAGRSARGVQRGSGVILLVSAVRLLLGGVTFGLFTPMVVLYTGTTVLLLEGGFRLVRGRGLLAWAVALGICDAVAVYVDFQLSILFYRLFYADWYIVLRIGIEGFIYTFIGVLLGARLGRGLWRVSD